MKKMMKKEEGRGNALSTRRDVLKELMVNSETATTTRKRRVIKLPDKCERNSRSPSPKMRDLTHSIRVGRK